MTVVKSWSGWVVNTTPAHRVVDDMIRDHDPHGCLHHLLALKDIVLQHEGRFLEPQYDLLRFLDKQIHCCKLLIEQSSSEC